MVQKLYNKINYLYTLSLHYISLERFDNNSQYLKLFYRLIYRYTTDII